MRHFLKGSAVLSVVISIVLLFTACSPNQPKQVSAEEQSKNLIVLIGDGMGLPQITLTRLYSQLYLEKDRLFIDDYLVGTNSTRADRNDESGESGIVTDSAASGTAFATGNKTYNGAISVTNEEVARPVGSVLEAAKEAGKSTGLITTARVTHATPAVYASHVRSRNNEDAIAAQYLEAGVDVLLGGGERHFVASDEEAVYEKSAREDGISLKEQFEKEGYTLMHSKDDLKKAKESKKLLGLFSASHIPYNLDRDETVPSLKEQFDAAVQVLENNEEGFVMMIEGGRIDHAGHANDLHSIVQEMLEFDEVFEAAVEYAKEKGDTSVIATADHETGGLTIGSQNIYDAYLDVFQPITASSEVIGKALEEAETIEDVKTIVKEHTTIDNLSDEEAAFIMSGNLPDGSVSSYKREGSFNAVIAKRGIFGWTGHGHTGVDVGVYGYGPAAERLRGFNDNTDFAKRGAEALGLSLDDVTKKLQDRYIYPKYRLTADETFVFPAKALGEVLDFDVQEENDHYILKGHQQIQIPKNAEAVVIEEKTYPLLVEENALYVPEAIIQLLAKKDVTWDALSERFVFEKEE